PVEVAAVSVGRLWRAGTGRAGAGVSHDGVDALARYGPGEPHHLRVVFSRAARIEFGGAVARNWAGREPPRRDQRRHALTVWLPCACDVWSSDRPGLPGIFANVP